MASDHMARHNTWIEQGFADGVFQCMGSLKAEGGGAIVAIRETRTELEARVAADPFVEHDVVKAEITEVEVKRTASELELLKE